jgi:uncharacterized protein
LLVNYRGFGQSSGTPSEQAMYGDALALHDWAAARADLDPARMVAFGRSLGSGVATYLAAARPVAATILATPFDSAVAVARAVYPWLPVSLLLRHRFESIARAPQLRAPLLMLVATDDRVIPNPHSERLYAAWAGAKRVTRIDGADHTDVASDPRYWSAISAFLTTFQ